jgi:Uma2 family endonuclease
MTAEEYMVLGDTHERYELIDGVVCMSPKPTRRHQKVLCLLQMQYEAFMEAHPGFEYYPDVDVRFDDRHVYAPDMSCFVPGRVPPLDEPLVIAPDLAIEVVSPGSMATDLVRKRADYGRFGVREYWVVDPERGTVRCFRSRAGQLHEVEVPGDTLASEAIAGFVFDLTGLRALSHRP